MDYMDPDVPKKADKLNLSLSWHWVDNKSLLCAIMIAFSDAEWHNYAIVDLKASIW